MNDDECMVAKLTSERGYLEELSTAMNRNYMVLAISAGVAVGVAIVLYIVGMAAWSTYSLYRKMTAWSRTPTVKAATAASAGAASNSSGQGGATVLYGDDEVWGSDLAAADPPLSSNDAARMKAAMGRLKVRYGAFNTAMTDFDVNTMGRQPTDLMDERIISSRYDDYEQPKSQSRPQEKLGVLFPAIN